MIYPKHIALIPDWNRTWAKENWLPQFIWHLNWFNRWIDIIKYIFSNTPIEVFTWWWLSTENLLNRSKEELEYLFEIYKKITKDLEQFLIDKKINFRWVWKPDWLSQDLIDFLKNSQEKFNFNSNKFVIFAINYWGRDEIIRWIKKYVNAIWDNILQTINELNEDSFSNYLDFWDVPNVDLVIRTKWDVAKRLSWFLLWRIWYAEIYFSKYKCPDLTIEELENALIRFNSISQNRNFWK